jgi:hypothetical protein
MSVVGVLHGDVAAAVSDLGRIDGRNCRSLAVVMLLLILECGWSCLVELVLLRWELARHWVVSGARYLALVWLLVLVLLELVVLEAGGIGRIESCTSRSTARVIE